MVKLFSARLAVLAALLTLGVSQQLAPAPAPQIISVVRCQTCQRATSPADLRLSLDFLVETDVAQFYTYTAEGSILVYFVARATFSHAPSQLQLNDFDVENGSVLEILAENSCNQFLLKGAVQQRAAWLSNTTDVRISAAVGATTDCGGAPFPAAAASASSRNGAVGSMYAPGLASTAAGPLTAAATNLVRLAFSEPVSGLAVSQLNVSLTPAPDTLPTPAAANSRRLHQAPAPAAAPSCLAAYQAQILPALPNSTQFYNVYITVPECFYGLVRIGFTGQVINAAGAKSLPVKPIGFNRVATSIPVPGLSPYERLPELGMNLAGGCA